MDPKLAEHELNLFGCDSNVVFILVKSDMTHVATSCSDMVVPTSPVGLQILQAGSLRGHQPYQYRRCNFRHSPEAEVRRG